MLAPVRHASVAVSCRHTRVRDVNHPRDDLRNATELLSAERPSAPPLIVQRLYWPAIEIADGFIAANSE